MQIWEKHEDCSLSLVYNFEYVFFFLSSTWYSVLYADLYSGTSFRGLFDTAILSLACIETTLFAGLQDGGIKVIDLETGSVIRLLLGHEVSLIGSVYASRRVRVDSCYRPRQLCFVFL